MIENSMEALLADGFARRMAAEYLEALETERNSGLFDSDYLEWAHAHGFYAQSACTYGLNEQNVGDYLSDYDIDRIWPLNDWQRIWINDKLTLGYMLAGTEFESLLPEYYYYTAKDRLLPLFSSGMRTGVDGLLEVLREKGEFACKPCNGALAAGFHMLAYKDGGYLIDGRPSDAEGVRAFVEGHPNYIFTEFIRPSAQMAAIDPLIHTLRLVMTNTTGTNPTMISSYLRFGMGSDKSGATANYAPPTAGDIGAYNVRFDINTGEFGDGVIVYANRNVPSPRHPDSGVLAEGVVEDWPQIEERLKQLALRLVPLSYLGFDLGLTDKGPKLMEINSHPGIEYVQLHKPLMADPVAGAYYRECIAKVDALTPEQKRARNGIAH